MRSSFCNAISKIATSDSSLVFLTGDLGFMALEPLKEILKNRFINAGVAEQNMISVAASLAKDGFKPWAYSIAPFLYARAFEQIRIDLAFHESCVNLVGNGAGFGYGVQGSTHHALEDYGILLTLPHMKVYAPCSLNDIEPIVLNMQKRIEGPAYLRLGIDETNCLELGNYAPWRKILKGQNGLAIGFGSIAGSIAFMLAKIDETKRPNYWICTELPISKTPPPIELQDEIISASHISTIEEHIRHGGFATDFLLWLQKQNIVKKTKSFAAESQMIGIYGDQKYMRNAAQIDPESITNELLVN
jgi:transketolase